MCKIKFIVILAFLLSFCSCQHEIESVISDNNRMVSMQTNEKTGSGYLLFVSLGHDGKNCPGCVLSNGQWFHVDCQGAGTACQTSAAVVLNQTGPVVTAMTTDTFGLTTENFFLMPDRSLHYTDEKGNHIFLNIPSQYLFRDSTTQQFTFTGLYFSETPVYSNN